MAGGWTRDGAIQDQIDQSVEDAVRHARRQLERAAASPGRSDCEECGDPIPEARRQAMPGARLCIHCQSRQDAQNRYTGPVNRSASKGSQMR